MKPRINWPTALVVVALLAAVTVLGGLGQPVTELISLGAMIIGALLYGEMRGIRENTNGSHQKLIDALRQSMYYSAQSAPIPHETGATQEFPRVSTVERSNADSPQ